MGGAKTMIELVGREIRHEGGTLPRLVERGVPR